MTDTQPKKIQHNTTGVADTLFDLLEETVSDKSVDISTRVRNANGLVSQIHKMARLELEYSRFRRQTPDARGIHPMQIGNDKIINQPKETQAA